MNPEAVFKAYDVRGRADIGEIDEELYRRAGAGIVDLLSAPRVAVGRDCRPTSGPFFAALADGITRSGSDVIDLGEVPTDAVYYYSGNEGVPGAMITASHNPPQYNGLKLCRAGAAPVGIESGLDVVRDRVLAGPVDGPPSGKVTRQDPIPGFVDHLFAIVAPDKVSPLKVAVDGGNGMAGVALPDVFARIPAHLDGLYIEPDGTFPNHPADPLVPENLVDLQAMLAEGAHDLGVAFDGDADRAFFLDETGSPLSGSTVTALIADAILRENPGATVVHNLITSRAVPEIVRELGGTPVKTRVGHSFIKGVMAETGAVFGGEHSGHYYFAANYRADSGMLAMLYLLAVLSRDERPLSVLRRDFERYPSSGEINFEASDHPRVLARVQESFDGLVSHLDGLTIEMEDGWFNLRPSNTEPLLRLNAEADNEETLQGIIENVAEIIEEES